MKRAPGLIELSRRDFCAFACGVGAVLVGCTSNGPTAIQTGGLSGGDDDGNDPPDAGGDVNPPIDASAGSGHGSGSGSAAAPTCPSSGATDVGAASAFAMNTPVYISAQKMFVVRDSGGLYALTAVCTHQGATTEVQGSSIYCPRHGATFTFNGAVTTGPATKPLNHFAMCTLANGHVGVVTSMTVSASQRLDA
jgi:nitrite reductase/ring-hydroxylating ferredoxin subunit